MRGLWTPVKCYFVPSPKWSDHKPFNRGINSQYWPVFLLRPAPMASSQDCEDRPPAQSFAQMERANWAKHFLFYNSRENLDTVHSLLLVQALWALALITASDFFWDVFVWTKDHTGSDILKHCMWCLSFVFVCDQNQCSIWLCWMDVYSDWSEYGCRQPSWLTHCVLWF